MKKLSAVRGAVCTQNTKEAVLKDVTDMCNQIFTLNKFAPADIVSVHFTVTKDITCLNPATALRTGGCCIDISEPALFCSVEPETDSSLPMMIRVMVTAYKRKSVKKRNVYLNGADKLRPDYKN